LNLGLGLSDRNLPIERGPNPCHHRIVTAGGASVSKFSLPWNKRSIGIAFLAIMISVYLGDRVLNGSRGELFHQKLLREFVSLDPMPGAVLKSTEDSYSPYNSHKALVGADYATSAEYSEIVQYYDHELSVRGWNRASERHSLVWGKDLGGREAHYCKGPLAASLEYAGSDRSQAWTYAIDLSWGLHDCE
jgi:hypothetical protein